MTRSRWLTPLFAACVFAVAAGAEQPAPPAPPPAPPAAAPAAQKPVCGRSLMTPEEITAHRAKMRSLTTPEQRQAARAEHHAAMMARAKERGVELPPEGCPAGPGMGMGPGGGMGMGPGGGGPPR